MLKRPTRLLACPPSCLSCSRRRELAGGSWPALPSAPCGCSANAVALFTCQFCFAGGERKQMEVLQLACLEPDLAILDEIDSGACSRVRSQQHMNANLNAVNVRAQWCAAVVPRMRAVCSQDCCPDRVHACNIAPHAGLDVDAMRDVAAAVNALRQRRHGTFDHHTLPGGCLDFSPHRTHASHLIAANHSDAPIMSGGCKCSVICVSGRLMGQWLACLPRPMQRLLDMLRPDSVHIMQASTFSLSRSSWHDALHRGCMRYAVPCIFLKTGADKLVSTPADRSTILAAHMCAGRTHRAQRRHGTCGAAGSGRVRHAN